MPASRSTLLRLLVALAAVAFLSTACGGDDDSSGADALGTDGGSESSDDGDDASTDDEGGSGDLADACDLISLDELETAFGFAWSEGESSPLEAGIVQCVWSDADPAMPAKIVSLAVGSDDTFEDAFNQSAKELYDGTKAFVEDADILEADVGLGDESYRTEGGIYVLDGDRYYSFTTIGGVSDDAVAGMKAMAAAVLDG